MKHKTINTHFMDNVYNHRQQSNHDKVEITFRAIIFFPEIQSQYEGNSLSIKNSTTYKIKLCVPERVSISCPTCGTRHEFTVGN